MRGGGFRGGGGGGVGGGGARGGVGGARARRDSTKVKIAGACTGPSTSSSTVGGGSSLGRDSTVDERYHNFDNYESLDHKEHCQKKVALLEKAVRDWGVNGRLAPTLQPLFREILIGCPETAILNDVVMSDEEYSALWKSRRSGESDEF